MARARVELEIDVTTGKVVGAKLVAGGGGTGAAAASAARGGASAGQPVGGGGLSAGQQASAFAGRPTPSFFLGPIGFATQQAFAAATNENMAGLAQQAALKVQAARAAAFAGASRVLDNSVTGSALKSMGIDGRELATAIAEAVAASMDKVLRRAAETSQQAVGRVGGVVEQFARAGLEGQIGDDQIKKLLDRQQAAEERAFDARARVAALSGNVSASAINEAQKMLGGLAGPALNVQGVRQAFDEARRQAEQAARGERAIGGGSRGGQPYGH